MITVSAPSYRSYRKEDTSGCFNILRKGMSKLGSMEAFLPGNMPQSKEVYKIVKDIRIQTLWIQKSSDWGGGFPVISLGLICLYYSNKH